MSQTSIRPSVPSVKSPRPFAADPATGTIEAYLRSIGYQPGTPQHLSAWIEAVGRGIVAKMVCGQCRSKGGMEFRPYHKGRQYAAVAHCHRCGFQEEI